MRFCPEHWTRLRTAIADRGMDGLVARSGAEAIGRLKTEVSGGPAVEAFEPLMGAHNAIVARCLELGGLAVMMDNEDGSARCPLCYANERHKHGCQEAGCTFTYDTWCELAADDMLAAWRAMNAKPSGETPA